MQKSKLVVDNPWREYERRKRALPPMPAEDYERAVADIAAETGV